jgi:hypothetical protein
LKLLSVHISLQKGINRYRKTSNKPAPRAQAYFAGGILFSLSLLPFTQRQSPVHFIIGVQTHNPQFEDRQRLICGVIGSFSLS